MNCPTCGEPMTREAKHIVTDEVYVCLQCGREVLVPHEQEPIDLTDALRTLQRISKNLKAL